MTPVHEVIFNLVTNSVFITYGVVSIAYPFPNFNRADLITHLVRQSKNYNKSKQHQVVLMPFGRLRINKWYIYQCMVW